MGHATQMNQSGRLLYPQLNSFDFDQQALRSECAANSAKETFKSAHEPYESATQTNESPRLPFQQLTRCEFDQQALCSECAAAKSS